MLCNTKFTIKSNEGYEISLLMPSTGLIVDIHKDLKIKDTVEVNLTTEELLTCAQFLEKGRIPKTNIDTFLNNIKYLQCVNIISDVPISYNLIKMKEDWLRHNIPNELLHNMIDPFQGIFKLDDKLYHEYETCKLSVRKMLHSPKIEKNTININQSLSIIRGLMNLLGITNTKEKGVLVAGGSVFCTLFGMKIRDYDLFFYGYDESEAYEIINRTISSPNVNKVTRTSYAITFVSNNIWRTDIQFILRLYQSIPQILLGFDLDCSRIGCDGENIWITESALFSLKNSVNIVDFDRMGHSYEYRLAKYSKRNISVYVPLLDYSKIRFENIGRIKNKNRENRKDKLLPDQIWSSDIHGLSRLIYFVNTQVESKQNELNEAYGSEIKSNSNIEECKVKRKQGDIIRFSDKYTATLMDIYERIEYLQTWDLRSIVRTLHYKNGKYISIQIDAFCTLNYLIAFCEDCIFPQQIEFKKCNPGEQSPGSFNPITYSNTNDWYFGVLYHDLKEDD